MQAAAGAHLYMAGAVEQSLVQRSRARALALRDLKVDVGLRQHAAMPHSAAIITDPAHECMALLSPKGSQLLVNSGAASPMGSTARHMWEKPLMNPWRGA